MTATEYKVLPAMIDWRGMPVRPGDTVLYPRQFGYSVEIVEGEVVEIRDQPADSSWRPNGERTTKVKIRPARSSRQSRYSRPPGRPVIVEATSVTRVPSDGGHA